MKNKSAKGGGKTAIWIIVGLLIVGVIFAGISMTQLGGDDERLKETLKIAGCDVEPYITVSATDAINPGTTVTGLLSAAIVNTKFKGTITSGSSGTKFVVGDTIDNSVVNASGYVDIELGEFKIENCGKNEIQVEMFKLDGTPTIKIFPSEGGTAFTDDPTGGTTNASTSAAPITFKYQITMPTDEGSGRAIVVIENSNTTEVDKITMNCAGATVSDYRENQPDFHATESGDGASLFNTFIIDNIANDGGLTECSITLDPETGITIGTGNNVVYTTIYFEQAFADLDGTIKVDVQNSDGTAKHVLAADVDYDFAIGVAG